jgi:hypothetical protein
VDDGLGEGAETLTLTMGTPTNAVKGPSVEHQLEISEINLVPHSSLTAVQSSGATRLIGQFDGNVTVTAAVVDSVGDTHTYDWSLTDNSLTDIDGAEGSFTFDPAGLVPGLYKMHVEVSDGTDAQLAKLLLKVVATLPELFPIDTDQDGINDDVEGAGDSDSDGIPNYLDNKELAENALPQQSMVSQTFIMEVESGLVLKLGQTAFRANVDSAAVSYDEIVIHGNNGAGALADTSVDYGAGLFDFIIEGIPVAGQSVQVVLTQFAAITADAAYRKLMPSGWLNFVEDENNALASAQGDNGFCPPPGDATYTSGLNEGHWCVQLTIQDGGPNDADGVANNIIEDPSGSTSLKPIVASVKVTGSGGGTVPVEILILISLILGRRLRHQRVLGKFLLLCSAFVLSTGSIQAASFSPIYAGINVLSAKSNDQSDDFNAVLSTRSLDANVSQSNLSRSVYSAHLGFHIDDHFALELGYLDLGEVDMTITAPNTDVSTFLETISTVYPVPAKGWTAAIVASAAMNDNFNLLTKVGLFGWRSDYTLSSKTTKTGTLKNHLIYNREKPSVSEIKLQFAIKSGI